MASPSTASLLLAATLVAWLGSGCAARATVPHDPGAVTAEGTLATPLVLAGAERTIYARIRLGAKPLGERPLGPVNVALAIDTSGSMEGAPIEQARQAARLMIGALKDGDRLAVVTFNTKTEVLLPSSELDDDVRTELAGQLAQVQAIGTTDLSGGLAAAVQQVQEHRDPAGINRVILLGDGLPNELGSIETTARTASENGIAITTMGLGLDYDEVLMGKIADLSGGRYRYVEDAGKMVGFFRQELERMNSVVARRAFAELTAGPGVRLEAVVGATDPPVGGHAQVVLGDLARGQSRDIIVRMTVTPRKAGVPIELLDAVISFDDALENAGALERRVYFGAYTSGDEGRVEKARNADVELSAALAEAAATTLLALDLGKAGHNVRARELLTKGAVAARAQAKRTPSAKLDEHAASMESVAKGLPAEDTAAAAAETEAGYQFQDEALSVAPAAQQTFSPALQREMKKAHSKAFDMTH